MTIETPCFPCANGLYSECTNLQPIEGDPDHFLPCYNRAFVLAMDTSSFMSSPGVTKTPKGEIGAPLKDPALMKDPISTGRKRAAAMFPINDGMICEWAGLLYAGGGVETIVGCEGNLLYKERGKYARHHGPDKNILENHPLNVHRICPFCHNRWHALNNRYYGERPPHGVPFVPVKYEMLPHDPETKATPEQIADNEAFWATKKIDRMDDDE